MTLTQKQRLKICIVGQTLLLISVIIPTVLLANKDSTYYRFGPNEDLIIISIKINNWTRRSSADIFNSNGHSCSIGYIQ